ncbi:hypothetical protein AJ80_06333 [Polytolypa hystricis UAMH7299]|uniref:Uncharacterized protein n=1 Tax=Polytolypa hystricis (strain UAMH7299) TaxID=1447883 RepID=A0A2B7XNW8_POLH7|nr:hypothetical protein AJ80_06333 [Polytolypa hystricis UAMH7299]
MLKHDSHPELQFEKKNKNLQKLPGYARVEKRPILHPPTASPYAGAGTPKVVYVSTKTPFMSAAKRVQKLLRQAEKRVTTKIDLSSKKTSDKANFKQLADGTKSLEKEPVFIKATGRAIDKAMNVGKWFEEKDEYAIKVKTGTIMVVDDIVEDEGLKQKQVEKGKKDTVVTEQQAKLGEKDAAVPTDNGSEGAQATPATTVSKKRKRAVKEPANGAVELPESRTRWVNMVEIAVTLK